MTSDPIFHLLIRSNANELSFDVFSELLDKGFDSLFVHLEQDLIPYPAAKADDPGFLEIRVVDEHPRSQTEHAQVASRLPSDDTADREGLAPDEDGITHLDAQTCQELRPNDGTSAGE